MSEKKPKLDGSVYSYKTEDGIPPIFIQSPTYICEKHGEVGEMTIRDHDDLFGPYCMRCFSDLIEANCCKVTKKKEGPDE